MAESGDGVGTWPGFLAQVNNTFNLLRDIFGYALPGGVFVATSLLSKRFALSDVERLLSPYHPPAWASVILAVGACYIIGDILAATAYLPISLGKWVVWEGSRIRSVVRPWLVKRNMQGRPRKLVKWIDAKLAAWLKPWLEENPTEVSADLLQARSRHAQLFSPLERRETLTILAGSTSVALLGGWLVFFYESWDVGTILFGAGVIVLLQFFTGVTHLRRVAAATLKADKDLTAAEATKAATPNFNQPVTDLIRASKQFMAVAKTVVLP